MKKHTMLHVVLPSFFLVMSSFVVQAQTPAISQYRAKAVVHFDIPAWNAGNEPQAELLRELNIIKANIPKDDTTSTVDQLPNTSAFEIAATGTTANEAAEHTNKIVFSVLQAVNAPATATPRLQLMNKASASEAIMENK